MRITATTDGKYLGHEIDDYSGIVELEPSVILDILRRVSHADGRIVLESENYIIEGR